MSWSYSGDPATSIVDKYRFLIGDTDPDEPIMQNEEIEYLANQANGNDNLASYLLFTQAATIYARDIKRSLGPQSEDPTARLKYFSSRVDEFKAKLYAAGLSIPKYDAPKVFMKGMDNNPPVGRAMRGRW